MRIHLLYNIYRWFMGFSIAVVEWCWMNIWIWQTNFLHRSRASELIHQLPEIYLRICCFRGLSLARTRRCLVPNMATKTTRSTSEAPIGFLIASLYWTSLKGFPNFGADPHMEVSWNEGTLGWFDGKSHEMDDDLEGTPMTSGNPRILSYSPLSPR